MAGMDKLLARAEEIKRERDRAEAESAGIGAQEYLAEALEHNAGEKDIPRTLNPSEAVLGFVAWLTTRDEVTKMSARHDSGVIADLVKEFCSVQGLEDISAAWPDNLKPMEESERADIGVQEYPAEALEHNAGKKVWGVGTLPSDDGYNSLRVIYAQALEQAQGGKGLERHANGLPFDQQPICQGGRRFGVGCLVYQAWKKSHETPVLLAMDNGKERAVRELLGVINYAAAAIIVLQEDKAS